MTTLHCNMATPPKIHIDPTHILAEDFEKLLISKYDIFYRRIVEYVLNIIEKPVKDLKINAGIYVINPKIKNFLKKNTYQDMTDLINLLLKKKCKVEIFPLHETWTDYGLKKNIIKHQL